jgi:hypothetical protein
LRAFGRGRPAQDRHGWKREFDILVNGTLLESVALEGDTATDFYTRDFAIPAALVQQANGRLDWY